MLELMKKALLISAGLASLTAEKFDQVVEEIVKKGEMSESQGKEFLRDLKEISAKAKKEMGEKIEKRVHDALRRLNLPTKKDVEELKARIEELEKALEKKT